MSHPIVDFDPFASGYLADPLPVLARLRAEAPVGYAPGLGHWVVSRHADVRAVLSDPVTFSARNAVSPVCPFTDEVGRILRDGGFNAPPVLANLDPPEHARARRAAARAFTPRRLAGLDPVIRRLAQRHVDGFGPAGPVDFVERLALELPALVLFVLLGIPEADVGRVKAWASGRLDLIWGRPTPDDQRHLARELAAFWGYCQGLVAARREHPGADLLSELLAASGHGDEHPLDPSEVATVAFALLFAGHETTTNLLANTVHQVLARPGLWKGLQAAPEGIPAVVEEVLRLDSSVVSWRRVATRPAELSGVTIPAGGRLLLLLGSANHDEAVFDGADRLDAARANVRDHLSFGFGIHFCLGAALARMETRIVLEVLSERLPGLRLVDDQTLEYHPNVSFRGPVRLLVDW